MRKTSSLPNSGADSEDYPFGSIIDEDDVNKGTPVMEATYSDFIQSLWHFFTKTGMTPNGLKDNKTNGFQLFEAMERYFEPIATVKMWAGPLASLPVGWLECAGQSISKTTYPELFAKLGYTFGGAVDNFNLPNFRDRFPVGAGSTYALGATGGEARHTLTLEEMPEHKHQILHEQGSGTGGYELSGASNVTSGYYTYTRYAGGGTSHNNLPPYLGIGFIIKATYGAEIAIT